MKRRNLSAGQSRATLIASYGYGTLPPPPEAPPPKPADGAAEADQAVTQAVAAIDAAVKHAIDMQKADPDGATDPRDAKVLDGLNALAEQVATVVTDQAADTDTEADDAPAEKPATPAPPAKTTAKLAAQPPDAATPVDEHGNVDNTTVCATPDCGHYASAHDNTDTGKNTGPCGMKGCDCEGMQIDAPTDDDADGSGEGEAPAQPAPVTAAGPVVAPDSPPAATPAPAAGSDLNAPPPMTGGEAMGPAFTIPVAIIEGQPTGDGRQIAVGALTWRTPPLPLMGLRTETHDPEGFDQNDPAVICGRIDSFERSDGESGTALIMARGFLLANDDGMYFGDLIEAMGRVGVSADVAVEATEVTITEVDDMGFPMGMDETLTEGCIMGLTVCPYPAFEGAYIVLGDGTEKPAAQAIPQQADRPTVPSTPPAMVAAGGQLIHFMTYEECDACSAGLDVITASGAGPTAPPAAWFADPGFTEDDGRLVEIHGRRGAGQYACPITVTADGQVYGHLAPWGVCHIGKPGCVTAPKSTHDYAYFRRGQHLVTAEGERVRVGVLTADTGHAPLNASATAAMAHYDDTRNIVADVNVGEDDYGIWVAGAVRPGATEDQVRNLRASSISGDWRQLGGSLELVAALAVPVPGFPHAVVAGGQMALTAAGSQVMHAVKHPPAPDASLGGDHMLRRALAPLLDDARSRARDRIAALR